MIADVVFDLPRRTSFSYLVPAGLAVARGQRVRAPLQGRARVGLVVDLREADGRTLQAVQGLVEPVPVLPRVALDLGRWAAEESLSSLGSTLLSMLPPLPRHARLEPLAPPPESHPGPPQTPELSVGPRRAEDLVESLDRHPGVALVVTPDIASAARWAERLGAARLDSGAPEADRRAAWFAASSGRGRIVVGTRSALLVPLPAPATLVLIDEHDPAHKPPGAPRLHSRELLKRRAAIEGSRLVMLSATPSVESWALAEEGFIDRRRDQRASWPEITTADPRGILRNHPLTLPLTRAIEETTRAGRRVALIVPQRAAGLGCEDCGAPLRCPDCGVAQALSRVDRTLSCRLCGRRRPVPELCPACRGHRLSPLGWGVERVEASVQKRFPRLVISRVSQHAQVLVGTPALLRNLPSGRVGCVGFVTLDGLLRVPDFRIGERVFAHLWRAAEMLERDGRLIIQTQNAEHYTVQAVAGQDRSRFYTHELRFRAELGYPPFRRLCVITVSGKGQAGARALVSECARRLEEASGVTIYPPIPLGAPTTVALPRWRFVIKGDADLPRVVGPALLPFLERRRRPAGMVEVEMDPEVFA